MKNFLCYSKKYDGWEPVRAESFSEAALGAAVVFLEGRPPTKESDEIAVLDPETKVKEKFRVELKVEKMEL